MIVFKEVNTIKRTLRNLTGRINGGAAGVPIVLARIDYDKREIGIGPTLPPGRSLEQDFNEIRAYYIDVRGRHPEKQGPITFMTE